MVRVAHCTHPGPANGLIPAVQGLSIFHNSRIFRNQTCQAVSASLIILIIIAATVYVSYRGFRSSQFLAKYEFRVDRILVGKDVKRLFTSGFLHVGWTHLLFNMFSLYIFSGIVQVALGTMEF